MDYIFYMLLFLSFIKRFNINFKKLHVIHTKFNACSLKNMLFWGFKTYKSSLIIVDNTDVDTCNVLENIEYSLMISKVFSCFFHSISIFVFSFTAETDKSLKKLKQCQKTSSQIDCLVCMALSLILSQQI